jgi:Subtilase family
MPSPRLVSAAVSASVCLLVTAFTSARAEPAALASGLRELASSYDRGDAHLVAQLARHITNRAGDPMALVHFKPGTDAKAALKQLEAAGFHLTTRSSINPSLVEGYLPLAAVHNAAAVAGIRAIHAEQRPVKHQALLPVLPPVKEGALFEKADLANARGITGKGIRIAALSDSFDACPDPFCVDINGNPDHAAQDIANGALPAAGVTVLQDIDPNLNPGYIPTDEGRAMLQLVHAVAPDAQLGFASADNGELSFAENILALRSQFHADVICDDVSYTDEPMYSDGILAQALDQVSRAGAAYFSSAGNNDLDAYESVYHPIDFAGAQALVAHGHGNVHLEQIPAAIRPLTVHNFNAGSGGPASITQRFSSRATEGMTFQWDEPFYLGLVKTNYIVYVFDKNGNWIDPNNFPGFYTTDDALLTDAPNQLLYLPPLPGDIVGAAPVTDYQLVIGKTNDGPAMRIKYININGIGISERQNAPSTWGHSAARGARGVAAQYWAIPNFPDGFSSPGPVTIYLDTQGNRLPVPEVRFTPQITAADGIDTTFFGNSDPDGDGYPNFFGTSAAAPDAAAVAGLVLQAAGGPGSLSPHQVYQRLEATATPIPLPNQRWIAGAFAGPLSLSINGDWVRWDRDFTVEVQGIGGQSVASIVLDTSRIGLNFNPNPNRFSIGATTGPTLADITHTVDATTTRFTMAFAPGKFTNGQSFDFGLSVFAPALGGTQEDPDQFRGTNVTITLYNGRTFTSTVFALPKLPINNFTGFGLVNADAATR